MTNIFISYGHDEYANIADKLFDRLSELKDKNNNNKFHIEKDNRGTIKSGHLWYSDLDKAIRKSDFIIYLMGKHSTREGGVCLDEIALAKNCKISIIPVRIENIASPFLVCSLQWIDWLECPENFDVIFNKILEAINDYDLNVKKSSQDIIFSRLFKSEFFCEMDEIIGRESIISEIEEFIRGDIIGPLVIKGIAGSGKSAIISELSKNTVLVRSVHRCRFDFQETRTSHNTLCNLSYFLSRNNKRYEVQIGTTDIDNVDTWDLKKLFDKLFIKPLSDEKEKYAIVIDGIDEMEFSEANELIKVLRDGAKYIPNVKFIISVRAERRFSASCVGLPCIELTEEKNRAAAEKMISKRLKECGILTEKLLHKMLDASESNFLYLTKLFEDCDINGKKISEDTVFPEGLTAQYADSMRRFFPDEKLYRDEYAPVLSVLCAAKRPVATEELSAATGYSKIKLNNTMLKLRYLIKFEAERISVYHRSMQEFLMSENSEEYMIDPDEGDKLIVENAFQAKMRELKRNEYFSNYLFCHIFRQMDADFADRIYCEDSEWTEKCATSSILVFGEKEFSFFADTVCDMKNGKSFTNKVFWNFYNDRKIHIAWLLAESLESISILLEDVMQYKGLCCLVSDRLEEAKSHIEQALKFAKSKAEKYPSYDNLSETAICYAWLGDIAIKEDKIKEAKSLYSLAFEIAEQNEKDYPSYESSRDLLIGYRTMADVALTEDNFGEAKRLYSLALEIAERNATNFPSYESRRNLSICYNNMAHISQIADDIPKAKMLYSLSLKIVELLVADFPSYQSKRDLAVCYNKLAIIAGNEGNISEVKRLYSLAFEIVKQLVEDFPSYQSRRDLSICYYRMGNIALYEENIQEAKRLYYLSLEIVKQLADNYPSYQSRRNLANGYGKVGVIALKENNIREAERLFSLCLEITEQNARDFPSYQSKHDLSKAYERMGDIASEEGNIHKAEKFYLLAFEINEYDLKTFPSFKTRCGFAISCYNLAEIMIRQNKKAEAKQIVILGLVPAKENLEQLPQNDSQEIYDSLQKLFKQC